jgi:hypothetical protein
MFTVASQIKLLIITPEQIWHCLENQEFLQASGLFLIAEATHAQMQKENKHIYATFPIVQRQWNALFPFKQTIVDKALLSLKSSDSVFI